MSSVIVRNAVRGAWDGLMAGVPFYETINQILPRGVTLPDVWGTLTFRADTRVPLTMGSAPIFEERGAVTVVVAAKSGSGDEDVIRAASDASLAWLGWCAPGGRIWFQQVGAPQQLDEEASGEWFLIGVPCDYVAQYTAPLPEQARGFVLNAASGSFNLATP